LSAGHRRATRRIICRVVSDTRESGGARERALAATVTPLRARANASSRPMPELAPVIHADFQGRANLERELKAYDLDPEVFRAHLARLLETMRFIEFRFRPEFSKGDTDVDRKTDEALNVWLEEARKRFNIVYLDKALR